MKRWDTSEHITENYPKIKNLVLYYSVFSSGHFLERSPTEKFISFALNELFNLNIQYDDEELIFEFEKIRKKLPDITGEFIGTRGFLPNNFKGFFPESYGAINRANDHLKYNKTEEANLYLIRTLLLAKHLKHKVCITVPPVRSDYKKATGLEFNALFRSLIEILNDFHLGYPVELINGFNSELFSDDHFGDYDHLLPLGKGTELLSKLIHNNFSRT